MADEPKKPRKIKDLKARLGRTISPNTPGAVMPPEAGGVPKPKGVVPPGGGVVPPSAGAVVPPTGVAAPKAVPADSPFAPKPSAPPPASADPFAAPTAAAPAGPQEVRLVLDDSAVDDSEVGKTQKGKTFILLGLGLILGLVVGIGSGSVMGQRKTTNLGIRDAQAIQEAVQTASARVLEAQRLVDEAAAAAIANPPTVNYEAIEQLAAMEDPFPADVFSNRNYILFEPATVNAIFNYYQTTKRAWTSIQSINSLTTGEDRRNQLNASAEAAGASRSMVGCVPNIADNRFVCNLGFVNIEEVDGSPQVNVRAARRSRRQQEKTVFTGQDLNETPEQYVILVNNQESAGVLGEQASLFNQYVRDIVALKQTLTAAVEAQGQAENGVGPIAGQSELFTF